MIITYFFIAGLLIIQSNLASAQDDTVNTKSGNYDFQCRRNLFKGNYIGMTESFHLGTLGHEFFLNEISSLEYSVGFIEHHGDEYGRHLWFIRLDYKQTVKHNFYYGTFIKYINEKIGDSGYSARDSLIDSTHYLIYTDQRIDFHRTGFGPGITAGFIFYVKKRFFIDISYCVQISYLTENRQSARGSVKIHYPNEKFLLYHSPRLLLGIRF